jgi:vacuolar-type H+-ATPase subunit H
MLKIRPVILIGIGPQSEQTIKNYMGCVRTRQDRVPAILPVILGFSSVGSPFRRESEGIQHLTLAAPTFERQGEWPEWLPAELADMSRNERERTRAWMRAAMLQQADELQEFLLESIPSLSSFAAVEEMGKMGLSLVGDSEIGVYVIADLNDHLGSGVFVDIAYLTYYVCRQLGLQPSTTGLFYLPSATSPAPAEEAIAYAAFKELEHYFSTRNYDGASVPDWATTEELVPFNDGCYLLDNVNELGYTLEDAAQQTLAVGEWLYAMTLLDMRTSIREHRKRRYYAATLRGKSRAYESFGLAIRYIPQVTLMDWMTARLGQNIIAQILNAPVNGNPEKNARAFVARMGLSVESLRGRLRQQANSRPIDGALEPIEKAGFGQIETQARQVLQTIRERQLPALDRNLTEAGQEAQQEIRQAVHEEIQATLHDTTGGGLSSVRRFLEILGQQISEQQEQVEEQTKEHRVELKQSLATISKTHYTLRSVVMSIPPWPVSALSVVFLVALPLIYELQLIGQIIRSADPDWGSAALIILLVGMLGVGGFIAHRLWRQRRLVARQHKHMISERFELEGKPLVSRAVGAVYSATQEIIKEAQQEARSLVSELKTVASRFDRHRFDRW